jgi:four helix bundle protein
MFDHEKLKVYQRSLDLIETVATILEQIPKRLAAHEQLDRASTSIPLNIAEGNGKFTAKDRCRYFDIARGSSLECAACLDVLVRRKAIESSTVKESKALLVEIVSILVGLIRSQPGSRMFEEAGEYGSVGEEETEEE